MLLVQMRHFSWPTWKGFAAETLNSVQIWRSYPYKKKQNKTKKKKPLHFVHDTEIGCLGAFNLQSGSQLTRLNTTWCLAIGSFQDTSDSNRTNSKTIRTIQMRHTGLWPVRSAVAVMKKYSNFESFLGCKSRRQSNGVMHPEEQKNERKKETNPPFSGTPI